MLRMKKKSGTRYWVCSRCKSWNKRTLSNLKKLFTDPLELMREFSVQERKSEWKVGFEVIRK